MSLLMRGGAKQNLEPRPLTGKVAKIKMALKSGSAQVEPTGLLSKRNGATLITLKLILHNTSDDSRVERDLTSQENLNTLTVAKVMKHVESAHNIPMICQAHYFESTMLRKEDTLAQSCIREGDTIVVKYSSVADVEAITELVTLLRQSLAKVEKHSDILTLGVASSQLWLGINTQRIEEITDNCFRSETKRYNANSLLLVQRGGVEVLYKLYDQVLKIDYHIATYEIRDLEYVLARLLCSSLLYLSPKIPLLLKHVLENPTRDFVLKSFTRFMIPSQQRQLACSGLQEQFPAAAPIEDDLLIASLELSQINTSNLAEMELHQLRIASDEKVIQQAFSMALSPSFEFNCSRMTVNMLEHLSKNIDTHVYLTSPKVINSIFVVNRNEQRRPYLSQTEFHLDSMIFKSAMAIFFSEVVCHSADIIPLPLKGKICHFMEGFLNTADHNKIQHHLDAYGSYCADLVSTVALPYSSMELTNCHYTTAHNDIMKRLEDLCVEFGVLCVQYEVLREGQRTFIVEHGLLDYVVCLPWMVTAGGGAQKRACDIVAFLSKKMILQPPSLINLSRATLAQMHLGLKKAMKLSVREIVAECYRSSDVEIVAECYDSDLDVE